MRVLYVAMDPAVQSTRPAEAKVAVALSRLGHHVEFVCEDVATHEPLVGVGVTEHRVPAEASLNVAARATDPLEALPNGVLKAALECDVAFATSQSGAPLLAAWKRRTNGKPAACQVLDVPVWRLSLGDRGPWLGEWRRWFEALSFLDRIIANAQQTAQDGEQCVRDYYRDEWALPPSSVVYYGVDTMEADRAEGVVFSSTMETFLEKSGLAVSLGRLVHYKGHDLVMQALRQVPQEARPTLGVIGDGDDHQRLLEYASLLGLPILMTGLVTDAGKWGVLKRAQVGLSLNHNRHVSTLAPLEYVYAGVPGIVSDLPINRERYGPIVGAANGLRCVDPFDSARVADQVRAIVWPRPSLRIERLEASQAWIRENRSLTSQALGIHGILNVLGGGA